MGVRVVFGEIVLELGWICLFWILYVVLCIVFDKNLLLGILLVCKCGCIDGDVLCVEEGRNGGFNLEYGG